MNSDQQTAPQLSQAVENLLVARNLRGMGQLQKALQPGYCLRAASLMNDSLSRGDRAPILIGTGFPVLETFETDGPVGALALYQTLDTLGGQPMIVCEPPLSLALTELCRAHEIQVTTDNGHTQQQALTAATATRPGYCH